MATWEDGPEYAPLERPAEFSLPEAPPLEPVPHVEQPALTAPIDRPTFDSPQAPAPALASLVPAVADRRDPALAFDVVSSAVTSMDSAWGAAHWSPPTGPPVTGPMTPTAFPTAPTSQGPTALGGWVPTVGPPWPPPDAPVGPAHAPPTQAGAFPSPGTPGWFGPGPAAGPPAPQSTPVDAKAVLQAVTPGLVICLVIGGCLGLVAPVTLAVAFALRNRVQVAQERVRGTFFVAAGIFVFFAIVGALLNETGFSDWWAYVGTWAMVLSWIVLVIVLVMVYRTLKSGPTRPSRPPYSSNWG